MVTIVIWMTGSSGNSPVACLHYLPKDFPISLGSAPFAKIRLISEYISRIHAEIEYNDEKIAIQDKDSINGLYVLQGDSASKKQRARLTNFTLVAIGEFLLRVINQKDSDGIVFRSVDLIDSSAHVQAGDLHEVGELGIRLLSGEVKGYSSDRSGSPVPKAYEYQTIRSLHELAIYLGFHPRPLVPTLRSLREIIMQMFPVDSEFDAFLIDNFRAIKSKTSNGMNRTDKINLLFEFATAVQIVAVIQNEYKSLYVNFCQYIRYE